MTLAACGDPAQFRPAKGVKDLPSAKTAYRGPASTCDSIGFIIRAKSIDDIAETTAGVGAGLIGINLHGVDAHALDSATAR